MNIKNNLLNFIFPSVITCVGCKVNMLDDTQFLLCDSCWENLICSISPTYFKFHADDQQNICLIPQLSLCQNGVISLFSYKNKVIKNLILELKFRNNLQVAILLAHLIAFEVKKIQPDFIVSVPSSKSSLRDRKFNQIEKIADELSKITQIPTLNALTRQRDNTHQLGLSRSSRLKNVKNNFISTENLYGKSVLLLDDVITTGATSYYCLQALTDQGANVIVLTLAYA